MGTLAKIVCLGFGVFYVLGLALFLLAPTLRKLLRGRLTNQDRQKANPKGMKGGNDRAHHEMDP